MTVLLVLAVGTVVAWAWSRVRRRRSAAPVVSLVHTPPQRLRLRTARREVL